MQPAWIQTTDTMLVKYIICFSSLQEEHLATVIYIFYAELSKIGQPWAVFGECPIPNLPSFLMKYSGKRYL